MKRISNGDVGEPERYIEVPEEEPLYVPDEPIPTEEPVYEPAEPALEPV